MPEVFDATAVRAHVRAAIARIDQDLESMDSALSELRTERKVATDRRTLLENFLQWPDPMIEQLVAELRPDVPLEEAEWRIHGEERAQADAREEPDV